MSSPTEGAGGFFRPSLPSPASTSASPNPSRLPHPRSQPLRAGSQKEETTRRYIENRLLQVSRRYVKKFAAQSPSESSSGYTSFREVSKDLSEIIDILWLSGTPSLQISNFLNIASAITSYMPGFPPAPSATFSLLRKLDHAFASLLQGSDIETGEALPGFLQGRKDGMTRTEMVRCKSLVESTRVLVVEVMAREGTHETDETDAEPMVTETEGEFSEVREDLWDIEEEDEFDMDVARVYEKTLVQLGQSLNGGTAYEAAAG